MGRDASSIQESDQVEAVLVAQVSTLAADACMEKRDCWAPSYSELDCLVHTPPALERGSDLSKAKNTWARNQDGCFAVEVPQSCAVAQVGRTQTTTDGELNGCWLEPVGMHA